MIRLINLFNGLLVKIGSALQSPFLLIIRLYWGWQFIQQGKNKFMDVNTYVERFVGWGIPMPKLQRLFWPAARSASVACCSWWDCFPGSRAFR